MATEQEIQAARDRLRALQDRAERLQGSVFDQPEERSRGPAGGIVDALAQGLTFGTADEIEAGIRAPFADDPFEGASVKDRFNEILFDLRQKREAFRETNPGLSLASEIGGGITQGAGLLKAGPALFPNASRAVTNLPFFPRLAAVGAAEGAAFGAGTAAPGQRLGGAAFGAGFGAAGGPLFGTAFAAGGAAVRPAVQRLIDSFTSTPRSKAINLVTKALQSDDITPEEATDLLRRFGSQSTLSDIGENLTDLTRTAQTVPGVGKQRARLFLDERQEGQRLRLVQAARNASAADEFDENVIRVINNAESKASGKYQEAYSQVLDITPQMAELLKRPAMQRALTQASKKVRNLGFSDEIAGNVTDVRYMDLVKRSLDDQIGAAQRKGKRDEVRILQGIKRQFVDDIDAQVPAYAEARNIFAGEAAIRDAVEVGRRALRPSTSSSDIAESVSTMTDSEIQGVRHGLLTAITDQLDNLQNVTGAANRFAKTPRLRAILQSVFPDSNALDDFLNQAVAEGRFAQTRQTVLGGSPTARIQASQRAAASATSPIDIAFDAATGGQASVLRGLKNAIFKDDIEPAVAEEVVKILLDPNVIPQRIRPPVSQRLGDFVVPRLNPRTTFTGAVGGGTGALQIDQQEPRSLLDFLLQQKTNNQ